MHETTLLSHSLCDAIKTPEKECGDTLFFWKWENRINIYLEIRKEKTKIKKPVKLLEADIFFHFLPLVDVSSSPFESWLP